MGALILRLIRTTGLQLLSWAALLSWWILTRPGGWAILAGAALVWAHQTPPNRAFAPATPAPIVSQQQRGE